MAGGPFDMDPTGSRLPSSLPTSPPPTQPAFSRPGTGPRPTPAPQAGGMGAGGMSGLPTNDEIEAKIQEAMSSVSGSRCSTNPPRDTRTQLFVGNLPYRVRWQDLKDLFRRSGTVLRADVSLGPDNRSRGYGTVLLASAEDAGRAIDMFNGYVWQTRTLEVRPDKMGIGGGVGVGMGTGMAGIGVGMGIGLGGAMGIGADGMVGYAIGGFNPSLGLPAGAGLGGLGSGLTRTGLLSTSASPFLPSEDPGKPGVGSSLTPSLATQQLARVASPGGGSVGGVSLNSPLLASPVATGAGAGSSGISLDSPRSLHNQLGGATGPAGMGERSRNLFVGNAGAILRADVALGPDGRSRGFGTASFATEADAERAVKIFNGYDYNGRQLKVHFDKYTASSVSAGLSSMSAPHSPHPQMFSAQHSHPTHATSLAQQVMRQQQQRDDELRQEQQQLDELNASIPLYRTYTDQYAFRSQLSEDISRSTANVSFNPPNSFPRTQSDSVQQHLHTHQAHPLSMAQSPRTSGVQSNTLQQHTPLHISLPPYRSPYPFDFSPGSPYGYDMYSAAMNAASQGGIGINTLSMGRVMDREAMQPGGAPDVQQGSALQYAPQEAAAAQSSSTSPPPQGVPVSGQASSPTSSNPGSGESSTKHSQPVTQATSPTVTSPMSAHSGSLHSHPAHPGPIALPPPVTAFPMPPPMSPIYHPQMSPYASPLHHPSVMMGVAMTPFGLPPITPSMPSFQFVPQPSPGQAPSSGSADLLSPSASSQGGPSPNGPLDPQAYPAHLRHAHGPMLSPYSPFSPGVAMSPGAFWGRPGSNAVNPYMNPAVGAPVHAQTGYFPPVPLQGQAMEEPQGYFPPFVPASSSTATSRPSGLANEIKHDSGSADGNPDEDSNGSGTESDRDMQETGALVNNGVTTKRPDSAVSEGTTAGTGTFTGTETSPRPASSTGTSWQTDSADPSPPSRRVDVEKRMQSLVICGDGPKDTVDQKQATHGLDRAEEVQAVALAVSDPVQSSTSSKINEARVEVDNVVDGMEELMQP